MNKTDSVAVLRRLQDELQRGIPSLGATRIFSRQDERDALDAAIATLSAQGEAAPPGEDAVTEEECEAAVETFASQPSGSYDEGCEARLMRAVLEQFLAARTGKGEANGR